MPSITPLFNNELDILNSEISKRKTCFGIEEEIKGQYKFQANLWNCKWTQHVMPAKHY